MMVQNSNRLESLQTFYDYVENETSLYQVDVAGVPWYSVVRDRMNNSSLKTQPRATSAAVEAEREAHFLSVLPLLDNKFDYLFFSRSKMRGWAPDQVENPYFLEHCDWLTEQGIPFLILEMPEGDAGCDLKMIRSRYSHCTVPHDLLMSHVGSQLAPQIAATVAQYLNTVEALQNVPRLPSSFDPLVTELMNVYVSHAEFIPRTLVNQALAEHFQVKAVIGGMGSHLSAGARNRFSVVEVHHGYIGKAETLRGLHLPVKKYYERAFHLARYFNLVPSIHGEIHQDEPICRHENQLPYGMPDLRTWTPSETRLAALRERLGITDQKVVLILTSGWMNAAELSGALESIQTRFPDIKILLRPHPTYDLVERHSQYGAHVQLVPKEHKYDLFAISDIVITNRSSMVNEAGQFTDSVIVVTDDVYRSFVGRRALSAIYPFARVSSLIARDDLCDKLEKLASTHRRRGLPRCAHDYRSTLATLHQRILHASGL